MNQEIVDFVRKTRALRSISSDIRATLCQHYIDHFGQERSGCMTCGDCLRDAWDKLQQAADVWVNRPPSPPDKEMMFESIPGDTKNEKSALTNDTIEKKETSIQPEEPKSIKNELEELLEFKKRLEDLLNKNEQQVKDYTDKDSTNK